MGMGTPIPPIGQRTTGFVGLLRWYDFVQVPDPMVPGGPAIATTPLPAPPATIGPEVTVGDLFITLSNITLETRQELSATIVWNFPFTTLPGPQLATFGEMLLSPGNAYVP